MNIHQWLEDHEAELTEIRRYLHAHPEIGFNEHHTSTYLKEKLAGAGYDLHQTEAMQEGFFIEWGNGNGPTLAIRCDLDALPIHDTKQVPYRSKNEGVMHACGHDVHMTIATGLALWMKDNSTPIPGKLRIMYQPAEETAPGGALAMIKGGAIEEVDHIIGFHVLPKLKAGQIGLKPGPMSAAVEAHSFTFEGRGGHTSRPEETEDLVTIVSGFVLELKSRLDDHQKTSQPFVLAFGHIEGGYTYNVIPDSLMIRGTFRFLHEETKMEVNQLIQNLVDEFEKKTGVSINHEIPHASPAIINDERLTEILRISAIDRIGEENIIELDSPSMGGEDFSFYLTHCPGVYFRIGCHNGKVTDLHTPNFDVDERCIPPAIQVLDGAVQGYFRNNSY